MNNYVLFGFILAFAGYGFITFIVDICKIVREVFRIHMINSNLKKLEMLQDMYAKKKEDSKSERH